MTTTWLVQLDNHMCNQRLLAARLSWQWAGHALWQCQGKARRAGVQACSCLCSGPANGMGLGRPYGTCEKNCGLWRLARSVTMQSPVRN
ncbi:hypothetical protein NQZ68_037979 [Dissostichus eleginoides]|nr:hypothetical protein NQZ68_037979 [Dissostichus eleginoides]